jgi:hypothetical protein
MPVTRFTTAASRCVISRDFRHTTQFRNDGVTAFRRVLGDEKFMQDHGSVLAIKQVGQLIRMLAHGRGVGNFDHVFANPTAAGRANVRVTDIMRQQIVGRVRLNLDNALVHDLYLLCVNAVTRNVYDAVSLSSAFYPHRTPTLAMPPRITLYVVDMNAPVTMFSFASAYRQLRPYEKAYVDAYVADVEREANRAGERISAALGRPVPPGVIEASQGLLQRPLVCAAITERITEIAAASELTLQRVMKEFMAIGFASIGDYMQIGEDGQPWFDLTKCTPEQLSAIKSIKIEENFRGGRKFEFTLHDKIAGLTALLKLAEDARLAAPRNVTPALAGHATTEDAADLYASYVNG